jgi:hypothetical protein
MIVGEVFRTYLHLVDIDASWNITPLTGKVNGDFTKRVTLNGAVNATVITVTEVSAAQRPGLYAITFTPATGGDYHIEVELTGNDENPTFILDAYAVPFDLHDSVGETGDEWPTEDTIHGKLGSDTQFTGHTSIKQELIDGVGSGGGPYIQGA